jgi:hydrogenase maturation protease
MARVLIIGYGNPLRGDDGLGWHAAERLRAELTSEDVEVKAVHQLTPELSDDLSKAELAIFIDAAAEGEPGAVLRREVTPAGGEGAFTHQATPAALLAAARTLFGRAPEAVLFSVPVEAGGFDEALTPAAQRGLEGVCAEIRAMVAARLSQRA